MDAVQLDSGEGDVPKEEKRGLELTDAKTTVHAKFIHHPVVQHIDLHMKRNTMLDDVGRVAVSVPRTAVMQSVDKLIIILIIIQLTRLSSERRLEVHGLPVPPVLFGYVFSDGGQHSRQCQRISYHL